MAPQFLGFDRFSSQALLFVFFVQVFELLAVDLVQAPGLVRAEQGPVLVVLHPFHEEVGDPQAVEELAGPLLFLAGVLFEVDELENVGVLGFEVDGEGAGPFVAALVDVAGRVVVDSQHWHKAVAVAVGAGDIRERVFRDDFFFQFCTKKKL